MVTLKVSALKRVSEGEGSLEDKLLVQSMDDKEFSELIDMMSYLDKSDMSEIDSFYSEEDSYDCELQDGPIESNEVIEPESRVKSINFVKRKFRLKDSILSRRG